MSTIADRVRSAVKNAEFTQKDLASAIGMSADALSRALRGQRGFGAVELAEISRLLHSDVHYLITGQSDPNRLVISARHEYDHATGHRSVNGLNGDQATLDAVHLAYEQVDHVEESAALPRGASAIREALGEEFVTDFANRLETLGVDVVSVDELSTAYAFTVRGRHVIAKGSGPNWFRQNWSLAHELGHLSLGHHGVTPARENNSAAEAEANAFAAELLMPAERVRRLNWQAMDPAQLAEHLWNWGVSTDATRRRLNWLNITPSSRIDAALESTTPALLRSNLKRYAHEAITERMADSAARRFPTWLKNAHLDGIATGLLHKYTLGWMLGVDEAVLEVAEPERAEPLGVQSLESLIA